MKLRFSHISIFAVLISFLLGCSSSDTKIIPRGKMAEIYVEMLLADQWLAENSKYRVQADTSLVYEPIFNKYGYTSDDYRASVTHYMRDPERYSRILRKTVNILDDRVDLLKEEKAILDRKKSIVPYKLARERLYYVRSTDRMWVAGDSIHIEIDSLSSVLEFVFTHSSDSIYDGLVILPPKDSLHSTDSLYFKDSISVADVTIAPDTTHHTGIKVDTTMTEYEQIW